MKHFLFLLLLAAPVHAGGITHKITATAQASVDGSYSHAKRIGSTYSMSSSGVTAGTMGHLDVPASSNNSLQESLQRMVQVLIPRQPQAQLQLFLKHLSWEMMSQVRQL